MQLPRLHNQTKKCHNAVFKWSQLKFLLCDQFNLRSLSSDLIQIDCDAFKSVRMRRKESACVCGMCPDSVVCLDRGVCY